MKYFKTTAYTHISSVFAANSKFLFLMIFISLLSSAQAQNWKMVDSVFAPWGVKAQSFSDPFFCDMDKDGDADLFIGSTGNRVEYFENISNATRPMFRKDTSILSSIYANGYQFTNAYYPFLSDLDADNDYDLLIGGYNGVLYYMNTGDSLHPVWEQADTLFANVNSQIGTDPKPVLVDIDDDGDLDLFVGIGESLMGGPTAGITIAFRNQGSDRNPYFVRDNALTSGIGDAGYNAYPSFADLDKDGDYDMIMGRDLASFIHYKNAGTRTAPIWQTSTALFSGVENVRYWKDPILFDYDKDGDIDLIYGTDAGLLYYYTNTGTPTAPAYTYDATKFRIIKSDNSGATVSVADYDKDGDFDFISGNWLGTIQYYKNEGTKLLPLFKQTATVFSGLDFGSYSAPVFVDLDNDGDQDIVGGDMNGSVQAYINTNNTTFAKNTTMFAGINVAGFSIPAFGDIDGDGDKDLLVCAEDAPNIKFYKNTGGNVFVQNDSLMTGVTFYDRSNPTFADIDNDGDLDLILGRRFGTIQFYENQGNKLEPKWKQNDTLMADIEVKQNASCGFADFDGDTKPDAVIGEYDGTFTFFKNLFAVVGLTQANGLPAKEFALLQNYPNPFNPATVISYAVQEYGYVSLKVFDITGTEVAQVFNGYQQPGYYTHTFKGAGLASGVYFYKLQAGNKTITKKMLLLK
ncbi:MAG: T9SS type A sorting domain-containing protein [Ignavibacteriales bacterium]|nr:T9SS type A sorting domain-containing protein [Ignavibacteriales bacterium]